MKYEAQVTGGVISIHVDGWKGKGNPKKGWKD